MKLNYRIICVTKLILTSIILFVLIHIFWLVSEQSKSFAEASSKPVFLKYNVHVDALNQLLNGVYEYNCVMKTHSDFTNNYQYCEIINHDGEILYKLGKSISSYGIIDKKIITDVLPDAKKLNTCINDGCFPYNLIDKNKRQLLSHNFSVSLQYLKCLADIEQKKFNELSKKYYHEFFKHNKKSKLDVSITALPEYNSARYPAYLFLNKNQFIDCAYLNPTQYSLQILGRMSSRPLSH